MHWLEKQELYLSCPIMGFFFLCETKLPNFVSFPKKNSGPESIHHSKNQSKFLLLWKAMSTRKQKAIVETVLQL